MSETAGRLAYLTNYVVPELAEKVRGKVYRSVWLPPVADGDSAVSIRDSLRASVAQVVGESRAELLLLGGGHTAAARWMRGEGPARTGAVITVCVAPDQGGEMEYGVYWNGGGGGGTSPNRNQVNLAWLPKPIVERFFDPWLQGMGITNIASRTSQ